MDGVAERARGKAAVAAQASPFQELKDLAKRREFLYPVIGDLVLTTANNALYLVELVYLLRNGYSPSDISFLLMCTMGAFGVSLILGGLVVDRLGFGRAMTLSLLVYATTPLIFFYAISHKPVLVALALVCGFNSAIAQPAASVYTYSVIDRQELGRLFLPLYILSGVGWIGYYVGSWLLDSAPFWAFALSAVLVVVATGLFNYGLRGSALVSVHPLGRRKPLTRLSKFVNRSFALLAVVIVTVLAGSFIFSFVVPMALLGRSDQNSRVVGIMMSSAFAVSMVASLVLNRVLHIRLTNLRHILIGNIVLALVMAFAGHHQVVAVLAWASFIVITLQANVLLFSKLWVFIDVESGIEQGVFQSLNTVTGFLTYLLMMLLIGRVGHAYLFAGYALVTLLCLRLVEVLQGGGELLPEAEMAGAAGAEPQPPA